MRQDKMVVGQLDAEHGPRQDGNDLTLEFDCFFGIHGEWQAGALFQSTGQPVQITGLATCSRKLARTLFARPGFVDGEGASLDFLAVEGADSRVGFGRVSHGDERKAAGAAGCAIHHEGDVRDFAMLFEKILEIVFSGLKREITYVQFHCDFLEPYLPATEPFPGTGFQITPEEISADDLPRNEQNRT